jgi:hypothetical protein
VVDEELTSAIKEVRERAGAVVGVEAVLLLDADPRQLAALARQLIAEPRVLLLADEQLLARGGPLFSRSDSVIRHGSLIWQPLRRSDPGAWCVVVHDRFVPLFLRVG